MTLQFTRKKVALLLTLFGLGLLVLAWLLLRQLQPMKTTDQPLPSLPPHWTRYTHPSLGYTFGYPAGYDLKVTGERVILTNGLPVKTMTLEPREVTVANFELTVEPIVASWDEITGGLVYEGDLTLGGHKFREIYTGAEGDGIRAYFLELTEGHWLEFAQREYFEGSVAEESRSNPSYLDAAEQAELVKQILSTVRFIQNQRSSPSG